MNDQAVLIVDDHSPATEVFKSVLKTNGYANEVAVVHDGQEALDWLFGTNDYAGRDTRAAPCLVLLDLSMPVMGGLECLGRIRADQRTELLPVVILSNSNFEQDKIDAYGAGANGYVDKLADIPFPELVRRIALYWLEVNEPARLNGSWTMPGYDVSYFLRVAVKKWRASVQTLAHPSKSQASHVAPW